MMKRNQKMKGAKRTEAKIRHIAGKAYDTDSLWKQGNIQMVMSEDHASCWVHKDLTVTAKQIQKTAGKWQKCESYFGALTWWIGSAPVQMSRCCLGAALS